ncbi:hypothetical protein Gogos_020276, partial [Gossypium gossypioides]|nr:hypothetical protein [Gossypium gossypioides]
ELTCGVYCHVFEDILHVLRNCTTARSIWDCLIPTKWHTRFYVNSLQDWLVLNLQNQQKWHLGDVEWQNLFGVIAWRLWKNCSLFIFQDASWKANDIIKGGIANSHDGEWILGYNRYLGVQAIQVGSQINDMSRLIEGQARYFIDASKYGNVSRFINHSCSPNLVNHQVLVDSMDCHRAHIGLYASQD